MTAIQDRPASVESIETFDSMNPGTGEVFATFPVHTADDVKTAVDRSRVAQARWEAIGFDGRRTALKAWKASIAKRMLELADLVHRENGKPVDDALIEIMLAVDHLEWASKKAPKILGKRKVSSGMLAANQLSTIEYLPFGVIGVIGPWNYPVFTPMGSIIYALAAGNGVVFKPSEFTPAVGTWLAESFHSVVPGFDDLFVVVTGLGATGNALCTSGVDKLAFTGSTRTGKKVMAACADTLTPVLVECGGKDSMIVMDDANVEAAADAALWGAMSNGGQTCVGMERVYATPKVYDAFLAELQKKVVGIRAGSDAAASYGPITMPSQIDIIESHIKDALDKGGKAVVGGLGAVQRPYVQPTILTGVPEDSSAVREETFGPTLTVTKVTDVEQALEFTNATYCLGGAVFGKKGAYDVAKRIRSGMTSINAVISFASVPSLPFGGVGDSGFGRIHGEDGMKEFARPKAVCSQRFALPLVLTSFARKESTMQQMAKLTGLIHGR